MSASQELYLELPGGARVLFTERSHGNLSSVGGDHAAHGGRARERLRARIGARSLVRGYQVHGTHVRRLTAPLAPELGTGTGGGADTPPRADQPADGQATALAGVGAMVLAADCMPVALCAEDAVAVVHAGWRGLAAGVLEEGVAALRELSRSATPSVAVIGPCAGFCCYEVGPEVHAALGSPRAGASNIDLRRIAHGRLLAAGVGEVRDLGSCTICDERFFSHRREGSRAGRQAGVAWLS